MHTINAEDKQEESHRTIEAKIDADLHEFEFEERKFFVRLNQFVSQTSTHLNRNQSCTLLNRMVFEFYKAT